MLPKQVLEASKDSSATTDVVSCTTLSSALSPYVDGEGLRTVVVREDRACVRGKICITGMLLQGY